MSESRTTRRGFFARAAAMAGKTGLTGGLLVGYVSLREPRHAPDGASGGCCIDFFGPEGGGLQNTPYIVPIERGCTLCLECGKTCPTGAILPLEKKEDADMGVAEVDERLCVSHNGTGVCGACFTVCPLRGKAVTQSIRLKPTIHLDDCTGCGLCEEHCIVDDRPGLRAIMVNSGRMVEEFEAGPMSPGRSTVEVSP